jgi:hypothetical protein
MIELIKYVLSDFWRFIDFIIIIGLFLQFILVMYNRTLRHFNINKHGYPKNCDADDDFKNEE